MTIFMLRVLPVLLTPTDSKDIFLYKMISTATSRIAERTIAAISFLTAPMIAIAITVSQIFLTHFLSPTIFFNIIW